MNRISVAMLLQFVMELQQQLVFPSAPATAAPTAPVRSTSTTTVSKTSSVTSLASSPVVAKTTDPTAVMFRLNCRLSYVSLALLKEGKKFFETRIEGIGAKLEILEDTSMTVGANLRYFGVKDLNGTMYPEIISTGSDKEMAVVFSYATFVPTSANYPGYDMDIGVKMASVKIVFVNRYWFFFLKLTSRFVQELVTYFGTFAKIQEIISGPARRMQRAALESVKESAAAAAAAESPMKMNLRIDVGNPFVLVPVSYNTKDRYLLLDLGMSNLRSAL